MMLLASQRNSGHLLSSSSLLLQTLVMAITSRFPLGDTTLRSNHFATVCAMWDPLLDVVQRPASTVSYTLTPRRKGLCWKTGSVSIAMELVHCGCSLISARKNRLKNLPNIESAGCNARAPHNGVHAPYVSGVRDDFKLRLLPGCHSCATGTCSHHTGQASVRLAMT